MKLLLLSDTHNHHPRVEDLPPADVLIHAGDACTRGTEEELIKFSAWLDDVCLYYRHVIYVPGNHDKCFNGDKSDNKSRAILKQIGSSIAALGIDKSDLHILINESVTIDGITFFGSPNTKPIGSSQWRYFLDYDRANEFWTRLAKRRSHPYDVLITHDPPYRVGDKVKNNWQHWPFVGCRAIRTYVEDLPPALHVFGHIHEGSGIYQGSTTTLRDRYEQPLRTLFVNAAIMDEQYNPINKPRLVTLETVDDMIVAVAD